MTRTERTRARTSPVAGQTLSNSSPLPPQAPSYTPGSSAASEAGKSSALSTELALLERHRVLRFANRFLSRKGPRDGILASLCMITDDGGCGRRAIKLEE